MKNQLYCCLAAAVSLLSAACSSGGESVGEVVAGVPSVIVSRSTDAAFESAAAAVINMKVGWNLGNTLESNSNEVNGWIEKWTDRSVKAYETAWGQPQATRQLMHEFRKMGFGAIRVPVTWWPHLDADTVINEQWMARVEEVVGYVLDEGMYCILNIHHDTGDQSSCWLRADAGNFDALNARFVKIWQQIAGRFRDYDERLLFEGYNEMLDVKGQWNFPSVPTAYDAVNGYAQSFVNTVRATGGNNAKRNLIVSTYCAGNGGNWGDCNKVLSLFKVPTDTAGGHLVVEVHSYNPWQWDKEHGKWTAANAADIHQMFARLNNHFVSKGIPVIVGEYGAIESDTTETDQVEAGKYAACIVSEAKKYNIATFYWMGLMDGADRAKLKWTRPIVTDSILKAYYGDAALSTGIRAVVLD